MNKAYGTNIFLVDISLGQDRNGLELAKRIREVDREGYIIFSTSHPELTTMAYNMNVGALNYLYKSDKNFKANLYQAFDQIVKETEGKREDYPVAGEEVIISAGKNVYKLNVESITHIETHGRRRCLIIHTKDQNIESKMTLKEIMSLLPDYFIRGHKSCIVNTRLIRSIVFENEVYIGKLSTGELVTISKKYYSDVVQEMKSNIGLMFDYFRDGFCF